MKSSNYFLFFAASLLLSLLGLPNCSSSKPYVLQHSSDAFVKINTTDTIAYGKSEVSNAEYQTFLQGIQHLKPAVYERCKVDTTGWLKEELGSSATAPFARNYFSHPVFAAYPVVNISHYAAEQYCRWLSERAKATGRKVIFRLPTEEEFSALLRTVTIKYDTDDWEQYDNFHCNLGFKGNYPADGVYYTAVVRESKTEWGRSGEQFVQNEQGAYHIIGNVAEMLTTGGAIGGSWFSPASEVRQLISAGTPDPRVGFRIVMIEQ